jgi:hypothetical protein
MSRATGQGFTIDSNFDELNDKLFILSQKVGLELGPIIKEEARYLLQSAVRNTPPPSRQSGVNTIRNDLNKVAVSLDYQGYEARKTEGGFYGSLAKYIRRRDSEKLRTLLQNQNLKLFQGFAVLGTPEEIASTHQSRRVNGRVIGAAKAVAFRSDMRKYFRSVSERVGFILSGWNKAADAIGVKTKKFAQKTYLGSNSSVEFSFGKNPFFIARNKNMRDTMAIKAINTAVKFRIRVTEKKIDLAAKKLAINLGFTKLAKGSY